MPYTSTVSRGTNPTYPTGAQGANPLLPDDVSAEIIQGVTRKSAALTMLPHQQMSAAVYRMPVLDVLPFVYWVSGDTGLKQTTYVAWRNVFLIAEELATIVPISKNVLNDVTHNIWDTVKPTIEEAVANALDAAVFFGVAKPASWPSDITTAAIAAGNTVTQGASSIDAADDINNVLASVEADGYFPSRGIIRQDVRGLMRGLRATTKEPIFHGSDQGIADVSFETSKDLVMGTIWNVPVATVLNGSFEAQSGANQIKAIFGDFSQAVLGIRQDIEMDMADQGVIQDNTGAIVYNLFQQDMVAMRVTFRAAYAVPNPVNRIQGTQANRFPFGVLRNAT